MTEFQGRDHMWRDVAFNRAEPGAGKEGIVSGWASTFDVIEPGFDTEFARGAFHESLQRRPASKVKMLSGHRTQPEFLVGVWDRLEEQDKGLWAEGKPSDRLELGRQIATQVEIGALDSFSIGFRPQEWDERIELDQTGGRRSIVTFTKVELREISFVVFRGNPGAEIAGIRSIKECKSLAEIEDVLRDAGLSRSEAKIFASLVDKSKLEPRTPERRDATDTGIQRELLTLKNMLSEANANFGGKSNGC